MGCGDVLIVGCPSPSLFISHFIPHYGLGSRPTFIQECITSIMNGSRFDGMWLDSFKSHLSFDIDSEFVLL